MEVEEKPQNCRITLIVLCVALVFINSILLLPRRSSPVTDLHIVLAVDYVRSIMGYFEANDGHYDNFNCSHHNMIAPCQEIDTNYGSDDDAEPIIVRDAINNSQAACIYSPLNKEKGWMRKINYWYCADSTGRAGYTEINPGSPGYCVEGESAVCPSF